MMGSYLYRLKGIEMVFLVALGIFIGFLAGWGYGDANRGNRWDCVSVLEFVNNADQCVTAEHIITGGEGS